ncbi:alcohol dehydrogenase catalytic domain-containing protein [Thermodesulfobacteriota bacterium]
MKALWLENHTLNFRNDVPEPEPLAGEAMVAVRKAGICATDLELLKGYSPFRGIPGHEFVGEIIQTSNQMIPVGQRVIGEINVACGTCNLCLRGYPRHCEWRTVLGIRNRNGAFAEYLCLPVGNLLPVPDDVSDDAAVFVEPLAAALQIEEQVDIRPDDRVLVIGAGRLGQLISQTLTLSGCDLITVARHKKQQKILEIRKIRWIDEHTIPDRFFDFVVEATGGPAGFAAARKAVRPGGTIVLKSTYKGELQVDFAALVVDEITIVGSRCGPFAPALRLLPDRRVDPADLIEGFYSLENASQAFEKAAQPGSLKVLFDMERIKNDSDN